MKKNLFIIFLILIWGSNSYAVDLINKWETIVKHKESGEEFYNSVSRGPIKGGFKDSKKGAKNKCSSKYPDSSKLCLFKTYIYTYQSGKIVKENVWEKSLATLEYWENESKPKTVAKKPEKFERAINTIPDNFQIYLKSSDYIILETKSAPSNLLPESAVTHCNSLKKRMLLHFQIIQT